MRRIEVVSFDMEGTLVDPSFSTLIWETDIPRLFADKEGISLTAARERVLKEYGKVGDERIEWYDIGYWFKRFRLRGDWRELLEKRREICRPFPEVRGVLERLRNRHDLIVISNTIREFLEVQLCGLGEYFTMVFSAPSDFGEVKKSADFYDKICLRIGVSPRYVAHIGDHLKFDYEVPKRLGIHAYYLDRSGKTEGRYVVNDLEQFEQKILRLSESHRSR